MYVNAITDMGLVRKENQDSLLVSAERGLFVVADGMGGHAGGQVASSLAVKTIDEEINFALLNQKKADQILEEALLKANGYIFTQGQEKQYHGMGTTVTATLFRDNLLFIAHIGDSRAYLYRQGKLNLLTQDHSLVNELYINGSLTLEEAQNHPQRNILTRALGITDKPQLDLFSVPVQPGDGILLCTDGFYNQVQDAEIAEIIKTELSLQDLVRRMVNTALERGGHDNITVIYVQY